MGEEKLGVAMTTLLFEDALNSAAGMSRSDVFVGYLQERKFSGVHYDSDAGDDNEKNGRRDSWKAITMSSIAGGDPPLRLRAKKYLGEPEVVFHLESLEYLEKNGPSLMKNRQEAEKNCTALLNIADNVKILPPPDDPLPWDVSNMAKWKASLCELIKELKTVQEMCPSLIHDTGVYVLTTSPYDAFLRALAAQIADSAEKS